APHEWPTRAGGPLPPNDSSTSCRSATWRATVSGPPPPPRWRGSRTRNESASERATGAMDPAAPGPPWRRTTTGPAEPYLRTLSIVGPPGCLGVREQRAGRAQDPDDLIMPPSHRPRESGGPRLVTR